jgi:hypothetical protein
MWRWPGDRALAQKVYASGSVEGLADDTIMLQ